MKVSEMKEIVKALYEELYWEYDIIGIRFENKLREEGEVIEDQSRNNVGEDEWRNFPQYGTPEYDQWEVMDGISTWSLMATKYFDENKNGWLWRNPENIAQDEFMGEHAYIIAGNQCGHEQLNGLVDEGEALIKDGIVIKKLW